MKNSVRTTLIMTTLLVGSVGCGPSEPVGYVTGKATLGESPLPAGTKIFFEQSGKGYTAAGVVQEDGTFTMKYRREPELRPGDYLVFVGPPTSYMSESEYRALQKKVNAEYRSRGEKPPPSPDWVLPEKYYLSTTSPLRATVEPGDNVCNFTLEE